MPKFIFNRAKKLLTRQQLIEHMLSSKKLPAVCKTLVPVELAEDLFQELMLIVLEYPAEKISEIKSVDGFLIKTLFNMTSKTGSFYKKYLKYNGVEYSESVTPQVRFDEYDATIDLTFNAAEDMMSKLEQESEDGWYMVNLFRIYMQQGSLRKVNKLTGIPTRSICLGVQRFKDEIKKRIYDNHTIGNGAK